MPGYLPRQTGAATRSMRRLRGVGRVKLPRKATLLALGWIACLAALQILVASPLVNEYTQPLYLLGYILGFGYVLGLGAGSVVLVTMWEVSKRDPAWLRSVRRPRALSRRRRRVAVHQGLSL